MKDFQKSRLFTINQAAANFGVSTYLLRTACKDGRLSHVSSGVKTLIHEDVLKNFLRGE